MQHLAYGLPRTSSPNPLLLPIALLPFLGYAWNLYGEAGEGRGASGGTVRNLPLRSRPQCTLTGGDESAMNRTEREGYGKGKVWARSEGRLRCPVA